MERSRSNMTAHLRRYTPFAIICAGVIAVVLLLNHFGLFSRLEYASYDLRFRIRGPERHADDIVIVGLDSQSLDMLGLIDMPPRDYHVKLMENLYRAGAKAVMFDFLFLNYTGRNTADDFTLELEPVPSRQDSLLAGALDRYPDTVIARRLRIGYDKATRQSAGAAPWPPELFRNPGQMAFVDMYQDNDSFVRRAQLVYNDVDPVQGLQPSELGWQYSFGLKAAMIAMDADTAWVDYNRHTAHVGDVEIPLNDDNFMLINYPMDERTYQDSEGYISYEQVLDDSEWGIGILMENDRFRDKVVLVGATWYESGDYKQTPFYLGSSLFSADEHDMYGVHIHKSIASTILNRSFIRPVGWGWLALLVTVMAVLATAINVRFGGFGGLLLSALLAVLYAGAAVLMFLHGRFMIPVVAPAFAAVMFDYMGVTTWNYLSERRQKAMIRGAFSQYVPSSVVTELLRQPDKLSLGGEERIMTVLFSDVAGFTTISEQLTPTELVDVLNEYLTLMTDIVLHYNGIIDKYEGDAIMAEFGAPLPDDRHAVNACLAALDMQHELSALRERFAAEGKPALHARIGISSGPMVIGNMGSQRIFDYTVMGDTVNLGSRLEGANKLYGTAIMCSGETRRLAGDAVVTRELGCIRVKGKLTGVTVYEVAGRGRTGLSHARRRVIDIFHEGLDAWRDRRWDEAAGLFSAALAIDPDDTPSSIYLDRCNDCLQAPPGDEWDGVITMETK